MLEYTYSGDHFVTYILTSLYTYNRGQLQLQERQVAFNSYAVLCLLYIDPVYFHENQGISQLNTLGPR